MDPCLYDSLDPDYKTPFGAVQAGETVRFAVCLPVWMEAEQLRLCVYAADCWNEPVCEMQLKPEEGGLRGSRWVCRYTPAQPGLYFYGFVLEAGGQAKYLRRNAAGQGEWTGGEGGLWQLTVYRADFCTPDWLKGAVIYQIFPDRFCNSGMPKEGVPQDRWLRQDWGGLPEYRPNSQGKITNSDYFGGDLQGILQKLPYLRSLGVTVLYLNPIFEAHSNHRYNTADYLRIDPLLGSEADFAALCAAAREQGIRVVLDGVFSHTGSDSRYFNREGRYGENSGAYRDPQSPYRAWYKFEEYPCCYRSWWNFDTLPEVEEENESYRSFICGEEGVIAHWLRAGASGFRLDVADELPDAFLDEIAAAVKREQPDGCVIGEVWEDASNKVSYGVRRRYLQGGQLDSVMNYPFQNAILDYIAHGDAAGFLTTVRTIVENYPKQVLDALMTSLSTHDTVRAITRLGAPSCEGRDREWQAANDCLSQPQYEHGCRLFVLASVLQYFLPGSPCLYYGDEAGLTGYKDPFNRRCFPWNAINQRLYEVFVRLGALRAAHPFLSRAAFTPLAVTERLCVFLRRGEGQELLVAVNRGESGQPLPLPQRFAGAQAEVLQGGLDGNVLAGYSAAVFWR